MIRPRVTWERWAALERSEWIIRPRWVIRWTDSRGIPHNAWRLDLVDAMNHARWIAWRSTRGAS